MSNVNLISNVNQNISLYQLYVIAPDKASGEAFVTALDIKNIIVEYPIISPRVIGDQISNSPEVGNDLAKAIVKAVETGAKEILIACNTLQLWVDEAKEKAKDLCDPELLSGLTIYTTFESLEWKFPEETRPVWLGTTPLSKRIQGFPTPEIKQLTGTQDLVQKTIWWVKKLEGSDVSTAPNEIRDSNLSFDQQRTELQHLVHLILTSLVAANLNQAIMGCTELPVAFGKYVAETDKELVKQITLIDPAVVLGEYIRNIRIP